MEELKLVDPEALPVGLCAACIEQIVAGGKPMTVVMLVPGTDGRLAGTYCVHNRAAAYTINAPGVPLEWTIVVPVEIDELPRLMAHQIDTLLAALAAQKSAGAAGGPGGH